MIKRFLWSIVGGRELWVTPKKAEARAPRPPMRTMADLDARIAESGSMASADIIRKRALPGLHVFVDGPASEAPGATRFGGLPDLPPGTQWPVAPGGERLMFLAQLDLADLAKRGEGMGLPSSGLL